MILSVSQIDCGDTQLVSDIKYLDLEASADNYDCLLRIETPQGVLRYDIQFVDNGDQSECEKYELLVRKTINYSNPTLALQWAFVKV